MARDFMANQMTNTNNETNLTEVMANGSGMLGSSNQGTYELPSSLFIDKAPQGRTDLDLVGDMLYAPQERNAATQDSRTMEQKYPYIF